MKIPGNWTIDELFLSRSQSHKLFDLISEYIKNLGETTVDVSKTQVSFGTNRKFAWVWLPQTWVKAPENSVTLTFNLPNKLSSPKIKQIVEPQTGHFIHHIVINDVNQFDEQVKSWLKEAYKFSTQIKN